ncbi:MAG: hypothetical protein NTU98_08770 [Bacteroidetes bacterium]|nr:hypothetical protein [Bacteroidota bacterium]
MKIKSFLSVIPPVALGLSLLLPQASLTSCRSERSVSERKIEKERKKKEKKAQKEYDQAVKHHMDQQSKNTKAMMKESKKKTPKNTPLKPASGTKCK